MQNRVSNGMQQQDLLRVEISSNQHDPGGHGPNLLLQSNKLEEEKRKKEKQRPDMQSKFSTTMTSIKKINRC